MFERLEVLCIRYFSCFQHAHGKSNLDAKIADDDYQVETSHGNEVDIELGRPYTSH
jgi:hypothetical protein